MPVETQNITIARIGHLGDGIAEGPEGPIYVPYTAPGDTLVADTTVPGGWRITARGTDYQAPPCSHYTQCGGCNLQHITPTLYQQTKREWLIAALAGQNIETEIAPMISVAPHQRRRATFTLIRDGKKVRIGFHKQGSHNLIEVPGCEVLRSQIIETLENVCILVAPYMPKRGETRATLTHTQTGFDLAFETKAPIPDLLSDAEIARARKAKIVRISWNGEILISLTAPQINLSGIMVELPPGAFLQPTDESQQALVGIVQSHLKGAKHVADLYAGIGTFSFALAHTARVSAFEGHAPSVEALKKAAGDATELKTITAETRDLVRRPLMPADLKKFNGVVLDPPRLGAEAQARQLAKSKVGTISYVSCSPQSFARDARFLIEGGFRLVHITPIDQFLWSHHIELVGHFVR